MILFTSFLTILVSILCYTLYIKFFSYRIKSFYISHLIYLFLKIFGASGLVVIMYNKFVVEISSLILSAAAAFFVMHVLEGLHFQKLLTRKKKGV